MSEGYKIMHKGVLIWYPVLLPTDVPRTLKERATLSEYETESAKITDTYRLPCKKVIYAVGPVHENVEESEPLLRHCHRKSMSLAVENGCKTIAFPNISCGVYTACREVYAFLKESEG